MKRINITYLELCHVLMGKQTAVIVPAAKTQQVVCPYGQIHDLLCLKGVFNITVEIVDIINDNISQMDVDQIARLCLMGKPQKWTPQGVDSDGMLISRLADFASMREALATYWLSRYHVDIAKLDPRVWLILFRKV